MDERKEPDPQTSRAETRSGFGSGTLFPVSSAAPRALPIPEFPVKDWDRYEFLGFLGQGGMGMVFHCRDRRLGREVAIKFVRIEDERHLQRFMAEARAQARVDHEHVCKVFEVGEVEGKVFISMQHIAGRSLDVASEYLSLEQKVVVLRDAALGLQEAHRVGIIHRDLKPSNIMVEPTADGSLRTFVMDFGLARAWNQDVTETGSVLGTPAFMSPEQARGEVSRLDRRTDVYSLGATLYHVATGRFPVSGSNPLEILSAIASTDVEPMRTAGLDIPKDLEAITLKCLEKDRSKRYDSAKSLADDLERFLAGDPVLARPTGLWYRIQRRLMKHKQLAAIGAAALLVVILALGAAIRTRREAGRRERLVQRFTESMSRIESMARFSALSPPHDIRPDLAAIQAHMAQLQLDMVQTGSLANGPGHYALGRGFLTLDDREKAREHLQMAWDAGFREPRVAYSLAVVLGREYQEKLLEAEQIAAAEPREARIKGIETALRAPALAFLKQARGGDAPSPLYLAALMAFYEGRLDEALAQLKSLGGELPWYYEAPLLRGSLLQARAWKHWNQGDRDAAHADFDAGRTALAEAAACGRSAPGVHAARAGLEVNALIMEKYGQGQVEPVFTRGNAAVSTALAIQPDHAPSLILQSALLGHYAEFLQQRGKRADELVHQAVAAANKAVQAGPARIDARIALGKAYYLWGSALAERGLDPSDPLGKGLQALESLTPEKRDYTVENHLGLIHQTWSDDAASRGQDPSSHLSGAIEAYQRATRMAPQLLPAWINLGTCLQQRAILVGAVDPEGDLQAALQVLGRAHALNPKHFVPYFVEGKVLSTLALRKRDRGEDPEPDLLRSAEAHRLGIAINPGIPNLHNGAGLAQLEWARTLWDSGRDPHPALARAEASYRRAIAVAPDQALAYCNLGDLLVWKARYPGVMAARATLREAEAALRQALRISPQDKGSLANLGRVWAARAELAVREGGDPAASLAAGEAVLAKALVLDPRDRDSHQYLGELRTAAVAWKALHFHAEARDFDRAAGSLNMALEIAPGSHETLLALTRLYRARAAWDRAAGREPGPSLAQGRSFLDRVRKGRPKWGEPLALLGGLELEKALALPSGQGSAAREASQAFHEAFIQNPHLAGEWKQAADRAQKLEGAAE